MKKLIVLAITAALMCSTVFANATEFKVSGQMDLTAETNDNTDFDEGNSNGVFFKQRFRSQIDIIASENVKGVVFFEIGDQFWGRGGAAGRSSGAALGTDGVNVETRRAFFDFVVPSTEIKVRAGLMGLVLPNAVANNPVFNDDVAALVASYSFDKYSVTGFFARLADTGTTTGGHSSYSYTERDYFGEDAWADVTVSGAFTNLDMFGLIGNATFDSFSVSPYVAVAQGELAVSGSWVDSDDLSISLNPDTTNDITVFYLGSSAKANPMENLDLAADLIYSYTNFSIDGFDEDDGDYNESYDGWFLALSAAYTTDYVTPKLTLWHSTGADKEALSHMGGFQPLAGWFTPTTFGFDGNTGRSTGDLFSCDGVGTQGIALSFDDISFIEKVSHKVIFAHYMYTDENRNDDSATEIDFITDYQMYEALSATFELAYIIADFDETGADDKKLREDNNAFKAAVSLKYAF